MSNTSKAGVSAPEFPELDADTSLGADHELDLQLLMDIPVTMAMEVGSARLSIRNVLELRRGSTVALNRLVGEPMDIKVNGVLIAHGEVVVVNEKFGIRLTDVVRPAEWIGKLK